MNEPCGTRSRLYRQAIRDDGAVEIYEQQNGGLTELQIAIAYGPDTAKRIIAALSAQSETAATSKEARLYAALLELVECRDIHDVVEAHQYGLQNELTDAQVAEQEGAYRRRKPLAWENARNALVECVPSATAPRKESLESLRQRFESWFLLAYPMFGKDRNDTTLKHRLWTAWQVAATDRTANNG